MNVYAYPAIPEPLRIGFLSPHAPHDRRAFSGTVFFAARALQKRPGLRVRLLGNHREPNLLDRLRRRRMPGTRFEDCRFDGLDAVVGLVASPLLAQLSHTHPNLPYFHVTDATPAFLRDVYGWALPIDADAIEARVARSATACIFSSEALAARAPADVGYPDLVTSVQPFGVNIETLPDARPTKPSLNKINLLYVGVDWVRKGGDIAVAVLNKLLDSGQDATLTIVGRCPEKHRNHPAIRALGFLNKNRQGDAMTLARLYAEAHLLLLPSRADCTPMVVAEAMAFGTPVLASDVGGIAGQIGGTGAGRVIQPYADPSEWVAAIREISHSQDGYDFFSDAAFDRARSQLNWDIWAAGIETKIIQALSARNLQPEQSGTRITVAAQ